MKEIVKRRLVKFLCWNSNEDLSTKEKTDWYTTDEHIEKSPNFLLGEEEILKRTLAILNGKICGLVFANNLSKVNRLSLDEMYTLLKNNNSYDRTMKDLELLKTNVNPPEEFYNDLVFGR